MTEHEWNYLRPYAEAAVAAANAHDAARHSGTDPLQLRRLSADVAIAEYAYQRALQHVTTGCVTVEEPAV